MATRKVTLNELKVSELKKELEERELETTGCKTVLQQRLAEDLTKNGKDTETYLYLKFLAV